MGKLIGELQGKQNGLPVSAEGDNTNGGAGKSNYIDEMKLADTKFNIGDIIEVSVRPGGKRE